MAKLPSYGKLRPTFRTRAGRAGKKVGRAVKSKAYNAGSTAARTPDGETIGSLSPQEKTTRRLGRGHDLYNGLAVGLVGGGAVGVATHPKRPRRQADIYKGLRVPRITTMGSESERGLKMHAKARSVPGMPHMISVAADTNKKVLATGIGAGGLVGYGAVAADPNRKKRKRKTVAKREKLGFSSEEGRGRYARTVKTRNMYASSKNKGHRAKNWKTLGAHVGAGTAAGAAVGGALSRSVPGAAVGAVAGGITGEYTGIVHNAYRNSKNAIEAGKKHGDLVPLNGRKTDWKGVVKKGDPFGISKGMAPKRIGTLTRVASGKDKASRAQMYAAGKINAHYGMMGPKRRGKELMQLASSSGKRTSPLP